MSPFKVNLIANFIAGMLQLFGVYLFLKLQQTMLKANGLITLWRNFIEDLFKRPSLYFFVFFIVFSIDRHQRYEASLDKNFGPFESDVYEYYAYLPDFFYNNRHLKEVTFYSNKRTIGMALMYSPAFFVAHCIAGYTGDNQDGFSAPYQKSVRWLSIIYVFIGLLFCRKNLLLFFSESTVFISLACIFFGTNLFHYTYASGEFPHAYLFFLISVFIYLTIHYIYHVRKIHLPILSFIAGFVILIRPTGCVILLFPLLFDVKNLQQFTGRIRLLLKRKWLLFFSLCLLCFPFFIQLLIWKNLHGHFLYYSYTDAGFFFNDPQIINFLFSFRKGWLVYTPIMVFSIIGMLLSKKYLKEFFIFSLLLLSITVYVLSSWCDWAFGGSFGCRVLIEFYAFLVFPFAVFVEWVWNGFKNRTVLQKSSRTGMLILFYLLIEVNLFQIWQYKYGRIHWDGMTKEAYQLVFLKELSTEEMVYVSRYFKSPDYQKMLQGHRDE